MLKNFYFTNQPYYEKKANAQDSLVYILSVNRLQNTNINVPVVGKHSLLYLTCSQQSSLNKISDLQAN